METTIMGVYIGFRIYGSRFRAVGLRGLRFRVWAFKPQSQSSTVDLS